MNNPQISAEDLEGFKKANQRAVALIDRVQRSREASFDVNRFDLYISLARENAIATAKDLVRLVNLGALNKAHLTMLNMDLDEIDAALLQAVAQFGEKND